MPPSIFKALLVIPTVALLLLTGRALDAGFGWSLFLGMCISWIPIQLLAFVEGYSLLNPVDNFWQFYFGDICLAGVLAFLSVTWRHAGDGWWRSTWWAVACLAASAGFVMVFYLMDHANWSADAHSGMPKQWHDLLVFLVFPYALLRAAPTLLTGASGLISEYWWAGAAALLLMAVWAVLMAVDAKRGGEFRDRAHPRDVRSARYIHSQATHTR